MALYASKTRKGKFFEVPAKLSKERVPGRRSGHRKGQTTEYRTLVLRYEQLVAAGGPQMLPTNNILMCGCSSPSCTVVLCAADIDGPLVETDEIHCAAAM